MWLKIMQKGEGCLSINLPGFPLVYDYLTHGSFMAFIRILFIGFRKRLCFGLALAGQSLPCSVRKATNTRLLQNEILSLFHRILSLQPLLYLISRTSHVIGERTLDICVTPGCLLGWARGDTAAHALVTEAGWLLTDRQAVGTLKAWASEFQESCRQRPGFFCVWCSCTAGCGALRGWPLEISSQGTFGPLATVLMEGFLQGEVTEPVAVIGFPS